VGLFRPRLVYVRRARESLQREQGRDRGRTSEVNGQNAVHSSDTLHLNFTSDPVLERNVGKGPNCRVQEVCPTAGRIGPIDPIVDRPVPEPLS